MKNTVYALKTEIPSNFSEVNKLFLQGNINRYEAGNMLGVSGNTFKRWSEIGIEVITESEKKKKKIYYGDYKKEMRLKLFNEHLNYVDSFMKFTYLKDITDKDDLKQELIIALWEFTADYLNKYEGEYFIGMLCVRLTRALYHYRDKLYASKRNIKLTLSTDEIINNAEDNNLYDKYFSSTKNDIAELLMNLFMEEWFEKAALTKRERQAVYAVLNDISNREAGKIFNCGKSTIQYAWKNAKQKLKATYRN